MITFPDLDRASKKPSDLALVAILSRHANNDEAARREATAARNVAKGRCGICRKKPYDCHCPKPAPELVTP